MQGWIKLHRKMMCNPIWQNPFHFKLWSYCLMKASHKHHEQMVGNQIVKLNPGEFITGRTSLADDLNRGMKASERLNELSWWRYLKTLENLQMLNIKSTTKYSVVSIVKWSEYQLDEQQTEQQMNNKSTTNEQQMNTNKNVKNDENDKNVNKKNIYAEFVSMTESEYQKLISQYGEEKTKEMIMVLDNYKGANGKKYKSDYRAVLNWVAEKVMKGGTTNGKNNSGYSSSTKPKEQSLTNGKTGRLRKPTTQTELPVFDVQ